MRRVACIALPEIRVEIARKDGVAEDAVEGALARVAEVALAFGPTAAFDARQDVVWVEVGGCAHLHGGEGELARALEMRVRALGHVCRVVVADGPRIASAVARFTERAPGNPLLVPPGKGAAAVRVLPITALPLESNTVSWLVDLGLKWCSDLQRLPRRSLGPRLGPRAHEVMQLLDGEDRAPLDAWRPPEVPEEHVELEWGARSIEALAFVLKTLCDRLAARLQGRAMAASRLELRFKLDRGLLRESQVPTQRGPDDKPSHVSTLTLVLPAPLARAADLLAVLRVRLEHHTLAAPALEITLRAPELARASGRTGDLLDPEPRALLTLPRLVAELGADLGAACVGVLVLADTWSPDERTRLAPYGLSPPEVGPALVTSALEPSRLVEPSRVARKELTAMKMLGRFEATEWWRRGGRQARRRDIAAAWIGSGGAGGEGALAWIELGEDDAVIRGWID